MLQDELDICGTHIPYSVITDYQVVQREYIYRPAYRERMNRGISLKKFVAGKYEFAEMIPYASVLVETDREYKLATKNVEAKTLKDSIIKDMAHGLLSKAGSRVTRKRYHCKNITGRCFTTFLDDIPAVLIRGDGKMSDVYKNDELYPMLGEPIAPVVMIVPALRIATKKEEYFFFGNRIQIENIEEVYGYLRQRMDMLKLEKSSKGQRTIEMPQFAKKLIPAFGKRAKEEQEESDET